MSPFLSKKHDFRTPLWLFCFIIFVNDRKTKKCFCFQYFSMVLGHQKQLISHPFSLTFHVFSKPLAGAVFRGSQCRTFINSWFLVTFSIFMGFKKAPFGRPLRPSRLQKQATPNDWDPFRRDPAFHEAIIITVPLGPSVFLNVIFRWRLAKFQFRLLFFVLCYICHFYYICW